MLFHVLFQSQIAVGTGFMEETWSRNLLNVLTTPVTEIEYLAGTAVFGLAKVLLALTTLSVTAFVFFGFDLGAIGWSIVPIAAILTHRRVGRRHRQHRHRAALRAGRGDPHVGRQLHPDGVRGVFNPVDALPGPLQPLARVLPSTHAFTALRDVLGGEPLPDGEIVAGLIGAVVVFLARASRSRRGCCACSAAAASSPGSRNLPGPWQHARMSASPRHRPRCSTSPARSRSSPAAAVASAGRWCSRSPSTAPTS